MGLGSEEVSAKEALERFMTGLKPEIFARTEDKLPTTLEEAQFWAAHYDAQSTRIGNLTSYQNRNRHNQNNNRRGGGGPSHSSGNTSHNTATPMDIDAI